MSNIYKIDHNSYPSLSFPYGLYVQKKSWFSFTWEFLGSFATEDEAMEVYNKIAKMPIMLGEK